MSNTVTQSSAPGSSPRVRGEESYKPFFAQFVGIIPAGAGKRGATQGAVQHSRDHPRGCGEKRKMLALLNTRRGSSPRVRGKARPSLLDFRHRGIIPAGAGKRTPSPSATTERWDHPRGCGEKWRAPSPTLPAPGSSPRVRGKGGTSGGLVSACGIIPAGAGKRWRPTSAWPLSRDHPRGCGEKLDGLVLHVCWEGSSPRVRGKAHSPESQKSTRWIIPAGAGKSTATSSASAGPRDHPRGCGEKECAAGASGDVGGSSPRVRGKALRCGWCSCRGGIIPAGAGKSEFDPRLAREEGDHPRGCGEKA